MSDEELKDDFLVYLLNVLKNVIFYIIIAVSGLSLISLSKNEILTKEHQLIADIMRDLGIACWVAFIVIITIEQRQRRELNKGIERFLSQTHEKLFQTILGVEFPGEVFVFLRDEVMKRSVFRRNSRIHYELIENEEGGQNSDEAYRLNFEQMYELHNLSGSGQSHTLSFFIEKNQFAKKNHIKIFVDDVPLNDEQLRVADTSWTDTEDFMRYKHEIYIKPNSFRKLKFVAHNVKARADTEVWRALDPSDGAYITISHPANVKVSFDLLHCDAASDLVRSDVLTSFQIKRPLLAHNGFMFWWCDKPATTKISSSEQIAVGHGSQ